MNIASVVQRGVFLSFRVNISTTVTAQAPFGGYKMSGQGRE